MRYICVCDRKEDKADCCAVAHHFRGPLQDSCPLPRRCIGPMAVGSLWIRRLPNDLLLVRQLKSHQLGNVHEVVPFVGRVDAPRLVADEEEGTSECAQSYPTAERLSQHTPKYVVQQLCRRQTAQHSNVNGSRDLSTHFGSMRHWGSVPIINTMPRARKCCRGTPQYSSAPTTLHHYRNCRNDACTVLGFGLPRRCRSGRENLV